MNRIYIATLYILVSLSLLISDWIRKAVNAAL